MPSRLSTFVPVDALFSSSSVVELLADLAGDVTIPAAAFPEAPLGVDNDQDEDLSTAST